MLAANEPIANVAHLGPGSRLCCRAPDRGHEGPRLRGSSQVRHLKDRRSDRRQQHHSNAVRNVTFPLGTLSSTMSIDSRLAADETQQRRNIPLVFHFAGELGGILPIRPEHEPFETVDLLAS